MTYLLLFAVAIWAGAQNALAGGGSFLILPTLMFTGMDALAANITSCVALFPAQLATGWTGRRLAAGVGPLSLRGLFAISIVGGAIGAVILLGTPRGLFARLVPWLVLFATGIFAWGSFLRKPGESHAHLSAPGAGLAQFLIATYGGYFGGGAGFLMVAALTMAGQAVRVASATKNVLAGVMNASAVAIFLFSPDLHWTQALITAAGATIGGVAGGRLIHHIDEKILRAFIIVIGAALTVGLFIKAG
ncbi:sulfite exporter TauE/SafE family protein [Methylocystis sp. WRRC1]|uniref:sulfite exporter TauE/SafE family protein n=1 Tax=unclassified Methylocystis TaxID=2625913 RepID=UPI0001F87DBF|nr:MULTISPECIES: sulfite exporter TauE/SafE family protein [unclassified Methylocystis]MCC3245882.1 sulfite exporter TauE/SafE family protein [Methylocystis sp. WRRC1]